jgi:hypothetical protein
MRKKREKEDKRLHTILAQDFKKICSLNIYCAEVLAPRA